MTHIKILLVLAWFPITK